MTDKTADTPVVNADNVVVVGPSVFREFLVAEGIVPPQIRQISFADVDIKDIEQKHVFGRIPQSFIPYAESVTDIPVGASLVRLNKMSLSEFTRLISRKKLQPFKAEFTEGPFGDYDWKIDLEVGQQVKATVKKIKHWGALVEIVIGEETLIAKLHKRQLDWFAKTPNPSDVLDEGQEINVEILSIDPIRKKIEVSYRNCLDNPWQNGGIEEHLHKLSVMQQYEDGEIEGVVVSIQDYGIFVEIDEETKLSGLLHIQNMQDEKPSDFQLQEEVIVKVVKIDKEKPELAFVFADSDAE